MLCLSKNTIISFDYVDFLAQNLSDFVSLPRKFDNPYYHIVEYRWCLREELAKAALYNFVR